MGPVSIILLLSALANAGLAGYLFWRRHLRPVHFAFAFLVFPSTLWTAAIFTISCHPPLSVAQIAGRLAFAFAAVSGLSCLVFSWSFPESHHVRPRRITVLAVLTAFIVVFGLCFTPLIQQDILQVGNDMKPVFGPLHPLYILYMIIVFTSGVGNLLRSRLRTTSGRERMQLNYCLTGVILSFCPAFVATFVLPFITSRSEYYLVGGASPLFWTWFTSYALYRHRLMDIGIAFRNVLIYTLHATVIALLVTVPFVIHRATVATAESYNTELLLILLSAGLLAFFLPGFQQRITRFVDQRLFRGRYDHGTALVQFGDRLLRIYGRKQIAETTAREISIIMQADGCSVYLPQLDSGAYVLAADSDRDATPKPEMLDPENLLIASVLRSNALVVKGDIAYASPAVAGAEEMLDTFAELNAGLAVPLVCQSRVHGVVFLGEKQKDSVYTVDDLRLLNALASQVAIALDNTTLYEKVLESKRLYETILSRMQRGVIATDAHLQVTILNSTASDMLGMGAENAPVNTVDDLVPEFAEILRRTVQEGANQPPIEVTVTASSRSFPCECETSVMLDGQNRTIGALVVFQDLTERKRFQAEVRRMDRLASVGTLAAGIAHEIKNPLVSIQTFAQLLPERYEETAFREKFGSVVQSEILRINRLVHSLLDFARPRQSTRGPVDLRELAERALTLLDNEIRKRQVEITVDLPENPVVVQGDSEQLYQVLFNLLQNAMQSMVTEPRQIWIQTEISRASAAKTPAQEVVLRVRDTGHGIDKRDLPSIFDPFYSTKASGSGLGLSICHSILKDHGATIDVDSTVGLGTTFTVTFSTSPAAETRGWKI